MGFEIGYLMVFDAATRQPFIQAWVQQHTPILGIAHIPALKLVYVGLGNGTVVAYSDNICPTITSGTPARVKLHPIFTYYDPTQTVACLLAVPVHVSPGQTHAPSGEDHTQSGTGYELWVGQKEGLITVLDAATLSTIKFIKSSLDLSPTPSYVSYLIYSNLVCSVPMESTFGSQHGCSGVAGGEGGGGEGEEVVCVSVYGALFHGQYVTRWNAKSKEALEAFNCRAHLEPSEGEPDFRLLSLASQSAAGS